MSVPDSAGVIGFSSGMFSSSVDLGTLTSNAYFGPPAATGALGRSGPSMASTEIKPVGSAETRL